MDKQYLEKPISLEISGYSRGWVEGTAYYDPETKELVDWGYDMSTYDIIRSDMEIDGDDIPKTYKED